MEKVKEIISPRTIFKAMALIGIVFSFIPICTGTYAGEVDKISMFRSIAGVHYLEDVVNIPNLTYMSIGAVAVPVLLFILLHIKKINSRIMGLIMIVFALATSFCYYYAVKIIEVVVTDPMYGLYGQYNELAFHNVAMYYYLIWAIVSLFVFIPFIKLDWTRPGELLEKRDAKLVRNGKKGVKPSMPSKAKGV